MNYIERMSVLKAGKYKVLTRLGDEILITKSGRKTLQGKFTCRFLAKKTKLSYGYVAKILKELVSEGWLEVIEAGKKGVETTYKLLLLPEEIIREEIHLEEGGRK